MSRTPSLEPSSTECCMNPGVLAEEDLAPIAYTDHDEKHDTTHNIDPSLKLNGYKFIRKICDTQQGELLEAADLNAYKSSAMVIIKKVEKALFKQGITKKDAYGMTYCIPNNILKEAIILNHLTVNNHCTFMIQFVHFFYSDHYYYLVTKQIDDDTLNLKQFLEQAQKYICDGKLDMKKYLKVLKYIFWQLSVWLHWMHNDMHCCHLKLQLEHVLLKDSGFIIDPKSGTVSAKCSTAVQICDFGSAEVFQNGVFECNKPCSVLRPMEYQSPAIMDDLTYDARAADIWALGAMLFQSLTGHVLHPGVDLSLAILCKFTNTKSADLVGRMLAEDGSKRIAAIDILKHKWFKAYYSKYENKIVAKSVSQKAELAEQKMTHFPYYQMQLYY